MPFSLAEHIDHATNLLRPHLTASICVALHRLPPLQSLAVANALHRLDALPVFLNDRWSHPDLQSALLALPVAHLITAAPPSDDIKSCLPVILLLTTPRDDAPPVITRIPGHAKHPPTTAASLPSQTSLVFFTSGTTGSPKPVPLTRRNIHVQSLAKIEHIPYDASTVLLNLAPIFHIGGYSSAHAAILAKSTQVFPPQSTARTPQSILDLVQSNAVTALVVVPAILQQLVDAADDVYPSVTRILYGGNPTSRALRRATSRLFPNAQIIGAYGMTESASSITFLHHASLPPDSPLHASAGRCPEHVKLQIRDRRDVVRRGEIHSVGDIYTTGPHLMPGYFSVDSGIRNGWFRTGDVGYIRDGYLYIVGRSKDMIKSGGENVFCREVEETLVRHPAVYDAAVVGIPHRVLGEAVAAAVVLASDATENVLQALREICADCLSPFKRPKWIVQRTVLPRNASGKVLKHQLRLQLESHIYARVARL